MYMKAELKISRESKGVSKRKMKDSQAQPQDPDHGLYELQLRTNKWNLFYPSTDIPTYEGMMT